MSEAASIFAGLVGTGILFDLTLNGEDGIASIIRAIRGKR